MILLNSFCALKSYGQVQDSIHLSNNYLRKFELFDNKEKFLQDSLYSEVNNPQLKESLSRQINKVSQNFKFLALNGHIASLDCQESIKKHLEVFKVQFLDTEESEKVCEYIQELMDIVGLKSSNGKLNIFLYGFDPSKINR